MRQHSAEQDQDFSSVNRAAVVAALAPLLPVANLLFEREDLKPYECDGLSAYRELPLAVALAESEEQAAAVL
ncbi:MAG: FAD-binding oxidoreductase, partial [Rhodocyclaceae bacterium]|nr:FAD-binding oxidoreductase [Rhodocyclaceae bacterium]